MLDISGYGGEVQMRNIRSRCQRSRVGRCRLRCCPVYLVVAGPGRRTARSNHIHTAIEVGRRWIGQRFVTHRLPWVMALIVAGFHSALYMHKPT